MSDNAFSVYVFHPPIVILAARMQQNLMLTALVKFLTLTCMGVVLSFALSAVVFRRIPFLRRIL